MCRIFDPTEPFCSKYSRRGQILLQNRVKGPLTDDMRSAPLHCHRQFCCHAKRACGKDVLLLVDATVSRLWVQRSYASFADGVLPFRGP